jgi:hypothetical protein
MKMSIFQTKKEKKTNTRFRSDENDYLRELAESYKYIESQIEKWKIIENGFNQRFPNSKRTLKELKDHYYNCVDLNLNRSCLSLKEEEIFLKYLHQYGFRFRIIANIMKRTENSIKNYYNRILKKKFNQNEINQIKSLTSQKIENFEETKRNDIAHSDTSDDFLNQIFSRETEAGISHEEINDDENLIIFNHPEDVNCFFQKTDMSDVLNNKLESLQ